MSEPILVVGARGKLGSEVIHQLYEAGVPTRCATRNPGCCGHDCIGGSCARFDYDRPETFAPAVDGVSHVFMIARPLDTAAGHVLPPFIDVCRDMGVEHIIFCSALGADATEASPLAFVERYLQRSQIGWTILRPNFYMENLSQGWILPQIQNDATIRLAAGDGATSFISTQDVAAVAVRMLTEPGHVGHCYDLTGGEALDYQQVAGILSEVADRTVVYEPISEAQMQAMGSKVGMPGGKLEYMLFLYRSVREHRCATVLPAVETLLGRPPRSFREFAAAQAAVWRQGDETR